MSNVLNTNINALNANIFITKNNYDITHSLERLSTGLRITSAADDASGMQIADSLRAHTATLGQAIENVNDGIGVTQIADKGIDEQIKILDTIKTKAVQAAQEGQNFDTRSALQKDINKLLKELDNIAYTTSYNGYSLLSGHFTNKEFQIGDHANNTIDLSIGATSSDKIGNTRFETGDLKVQTVKNLSTVAKEVQIKFLNVDGSNDILIQSVDFSTSAGTGMGAFVEAINKNSVKTGIRASYTNIFHFNGAITKGTAEDVTINGVNIGKVDVEDYDSNGALVNAINSVKDKTGVEASLEKDGQLVLTSEDGRLIDFYMKYTPATTSTSTSTTTTTASGSSGGGSWWNWTALAGGSSGGSSGGSTTTTTSTSTTYTSSFVSVGRLTLRRLDGRDIQISGTNLSIIGMKDDQTGIAQTNINLRAIIGGFSPDEACAIGANANLYNAEYDNNYGLSPGVITIKGAMAVIDIAQSAQQTLDSIRADIGATQNKFESSINSLSVTQTNLKAAESQIRDVDFASESNTFQKSKILMLSGNYALSQANVTQQSIMRLLQ